MIGAEIYYRRVIVENASSLQPEEAHCTEHKQQQTEMKMLQKNNEEMNITWNDLKDRKEVKFQLDLYYRNLGSCNLCFKRSESLKYNSLYLKCPRQKCDKELNKQNTNFKKKK